MDYRIAAVLVLVAVGWLVWSVPASRWRLLGRLAERGLAAGCYWFLVLEADPGKRSIAAAYRQTKGLPADATVRVLGYFGAWASRYRWQERGDVWDAFLEQLAAARKQTAELSARVMSLVEVELRRFESAPAMASMDTAGRLAAQGRKADTLARLA